MPFPNELTAGLQVKRRDRWEHDLYDAVGDALNQNQSVEKIVSVFRDCMEAAIDERRRDDMRALKDL